MAGLREHTLQMMKFAPAQKDHIPAFRIAVSVAVPLLLLVLLPPCMRVMSRVGCGFCISRKRLCFCWLVSLLVFCCRR